MREAILDATWALVTEQGLRAVTMSQIAAQAGIGRATLYKYYSDVEAILLAWHQRHVAAHLTQLRELANDPMSPLERLQAVLTAYAMISYRRGRHASELERMLHDHEDVARAHQQLRMLLEGLLSAATRTGDVRSDVEPLTLAAFCLHALDAAAELPARNTQRQLVELIITAVQPARGSTSTNPRVDT